MIKKNNEKISKNFYYLYFDEENLLFLRRVSKM